MLEIIVGRAGTGKTERCLQEISAELEQSAWGDNLYLLVPEHMTYQVEQELLARLEESGHGALRCSVYGFRRFARQILLTTGGLLEPQLTEVGRRLILRRLLMEKQNELQFFGRMAGRRGFAASLGDIIREFKCYDIKPEGLSSVAEAVTEPRLQQKLKELAALYQAFSEITAGVYRDGEDLLARLLVRLPQAEALSGAKFWLDGFTFFNPQERAVIKELLRLGAEVHITLPMAEKNSSENEPTGIFPRARQTGMKLAALARELEVKVKYCVLEQPASRYAAAELAQLEKGLFGSVKEKLADKAESGLRVVEAATTRLEAEAAAADIIRLCREKQLSWKDVGILVRDEEAYGTMLPLVLQDYEIPFFSDRKRSAAHHPLAELLRSALETVRSGWRYDSVFRALKTGFFPLDDHELDFLENYVLEFGIRGAKHWRAEKAWSWLKHSDYDDEAALAAKKERAAEADSLRRRVAEPLALLAEGLKAAKNEQKAKEQSAGAEATNSLPVAAAARLLYELLDELGAAEKLAGWAEEAEQAGRLAEAREHLQVWEGIVSLLEQMVEIGAADGMTLKEFEDVLSEGLDALEVSLIPPGLDYVTIASFDQNSLANVKAVYILGANAGVMPRRASEDVILSDADRMAMIDKGGVEFPLVSLDGSFNEKYLLYRGFTQAREYLWVSYALADGQGNGLIPSPLIKRIKELVDLRASFLSIPLESLERHDAKLQVARGRQAVSGLAASLRACKEHGELPGLWREVYNQSMDIEELKAPLAKVKEGLFYQAGTGNLSAELAARLFAPHRSVNGSVTSFERYQECPFKYFADKGLRLKEREIFGFQSSDFGTLLHAVLESFGRVQQQSGRRWSETTDKERQEFCHTALQRLAADAAGGVLLSAGQKKAQLARIERTAVAVLKRLCELDAQSKYHPEYFELSFRNEAKKNPLSYELRDGFRLTLSGKIDRIDLGEDKARFLVVDYKTGNAEIDLCKVYHGLKLQLLTYILAAKELLKEEGSAGPEPAGMLYCFVRDMVLSMTEWPRDKAVEQLRKKEEKMPGWIVDVDGLAKDIDGAERFLQYFSARNKEKYCKSEEDLATLIRFTLGKLTETGKRILSGEVTAQPYRDEKKTGCSWCSFSMVCGFEPGLDGCRYRELEKLADGDVMQRIKDELAGKEEV